MNLVLFVKIITKFYTIRINLENISNVKIVNVFLFLKNIMLQ